MIASPLAGRILGSVDSSFAVAEWSDPGGPAALRRTIAPWHVHHGDDEGWYVLEGTLVIRAGEDEIQLPAGSAYLVPHGTPHTYWNPAPERARYLLFMTPAILRLIEAIHALPDRSRSTLERVFAEHNSSLLDPPPGL